MTLIADLSPPDRRAEAASYFSVAVYGGIGIGPIVGEAMLSTSGFRSAFALAGLFAVAAALVSTTVPRRVAFAICARVRQPRPRPVARWLHPGRGRPRSRPGHRDGRVRRVLGAFLPDHARALGLSGSGGLFAVYSAVCLVLRIGGARLPERLGPRVSVTTAFTMLGLGLALFAAITEQWALWVAAGCVGVGMAFMYPSLMAFTVNRAPEAERPRAIASFTMFFEAGTAVGGLALGALADVVRQAGGLRRRRRTVCRRGVGAAHDRDPGVRRRSPPSRCRSSPRSLPPARICTSARRRQRRLPVAVRFPLVIGVGSRHHGHMVLDHEQCYRAVTSRDPRFDGYFVGAVRTTGIYCRPSCPAVTPKRANIEFFPTAAAAHEHGYRACKRCRPDASPGSPEWDVRGDVVARAMRLIGDGVVDRDGVSGLARGCTTASVTSIG